MSGGAGVLGGLLEVYYHVRSRLSCPLASVQRVLCQKKVNHSSVAIHSFRPLVLVEFKIVRVKGTDPDWASQGAKTTGKNFKPSDGYVVPEDKGPVGEAVKPPGGLSAKSAAMLSPVGDDAAWNWIRNKIQDRYFVLCYP